MAVAHILGFPRIGANREVKHAVESYWRREISLEQLMIVGKQICQSNWQLQSTAGLDFVTVGDFSWYDHVLDMSALIGVIPPRFSEYQVTVDSVFRMARGDISAKACEMVKWFDTNYHYIVPEFYPDQEFNLVGDKLFTEIRLAQSLGHKVKPVILGPMSYLWLGKAKDNLVDKLSLLGRLVIVYGQILTKLAELQIEWVQIDEPILGLELPKVWQQAFEACYNSLSSTKSKLLLTTYFSSIQTNLSLAMQLPVAGLHVDLQSAPEQLTAVLDRLPTYKILSCGIVDGRNIWRNDLAKSKQLLDSIQQRIAERLWVASSCSLLHVPIDLDGEHKLDKEIKSWLAFAKQKTYEIVTLKNALSNDATALQTIEENDKVLQTKRDSTRVHKSELKQHIDDSYVKRNNGYEHRAKLQRQELDLPLYPTTTIGSFPQTKEIRQIRAKYRKSQIDKDTYDTAIKQEIETVVRFQEEIGIDVLVHGEPERNDMVEYFAEMLDGFAFTESGWVQSYGSRCVKPPIIYGDVERPNPMTCDWLEYAKKLTNLPIKGMLTGPVTILLWSFVRNDQPPQKTAMQIALALRKELVDLEKIGINIIQIDEPAFREGLPLKTSEQADYLDWAVTAFKVATCGVADTTQIHTHMCYSEFNQIIKYIAALDADVITIESSRSDMKLLSAFEDFDYPNEIGPGIFDIHSPAVANVNAMVKLLVRASEKIPQDRLWVNPDCGLKTRGWDEVKQSLINMVNAAEILRAKHKVAVA